MQKVLLLSSFIFLISPVSAYVSGGSNLGFMGYPECSCRKPMKTFISSKWELDDYKFQHARYIDCVNEYIDNANKDIRRIKEKAEQSLEEANRNF